MKKEESKIVFIKNDIFSLIKLAKEQKKEEEKCNNPEHTWLNFKDKKASLCLDCVCKKARQEAKKEVFDDIEESFEYEPEELKRCSCLRCKILKRIKKKHLK